MKEETVAGALLGTSVGDALGLPYENLSPRRIKKLAGTPDCYRFLGRYGMVSDDTEHSCMVAQALLAADGDVDKFEQDLARRLKWWLIKLPAGVGRATAQSISKLWLGFSTSRSGVFSAGNGPAMRAPIIGAALDDVDKIVEFATRSARITHSDPKAAYGAIAVSLAAFLGRKSEVVCPKSYLEKLSTLLPDDAPANELRGLLKDVVASVDERESTQTYALRTFGKKGVSGYTYHTVPAAIHAWLSYPDDYERAVVSMVECGGDADSTAAIVGGIMGARVGKSGIPDRFLQNMIEWPVLCELDVKSVPTVSRGLDESRSTHVGCSTASQESHVLSNRSSSRASTVGSALLASAGRSPNREILVNRIRFHASLVALA